MLNCPKCGISIIEGDRFCSGCGHPADHAEYLTETKNGQNKDVTIKNKRSLPSVWWLALVVVLMGLASFLYFSQDIKESIFTYTKESNQQPEDSSQQLIGISEHIYQEGVPVIIFKEDFEGSELSLWRNEIPFVNWYSINHNAAADDIRKAQIGNTYIEYWTRSPSRVMSYSLRCVNSDGSFFIPQSYQLFNIGHAYRSHCGVRPVVNVKSSIPVSRIITRLF